MSRIIYETDTPIPSPRFPQLRYPPAPTPPLNSHPPFFVPRSGTPNPPNGDDESEMSPLPSPQRPHRLRRVEQVSGEAERRGGPMDDEDEDDMERGGGNGSNSNNNSHERVEGSEIPALERIHRTNGYRDGIAESKEKFVQEGFDEGYSLGAVLGLRVGYILGGLEGIVRALGTEGQTEATELLANARKELDLREIFGRDFFDEEGIWKYDVPGAEGDVTFQDVAEAHPILQRWEKKMLDTAKQWSIDLGLADERWGGMDGREEEG